MLRSDRLKPSLVRYYMVWANKCCNEKVQMLWNRNRCMGRRQYILDHCYVRKSIFYNILCVRIMFQMDAIGQWHFEYRKSKTF